MLLNSSLASGLGRPDLAFSLGMNQTAQTGLPATSNYMQGNEGSGIGLSGTLEARGPILALLVMTAALAAYIYWIHPHLK
jgi:hypothetical protein